MEVDSSSLSIRTANLLNRTLNRSLQLYLKQASRANLELERVHNTQLPPKFPPKRKYGRTFEDLLCDAGRESPPTRSKHLRQAPAGGSEERQRLLKQAAQRVIGISIQQWNPSSPLNSLQEPITIRLDCYFKNEFANTFSLCIKVEEDHAIRITENNLPPIVNVEELQNGMNRNIEMSIIKLQFSLDSFVSRREQVLRAEHLFNQATASARSGSTYFTYSPSFDKVQFCLMVDGTLLQAVLAYEKGSLPSSVDLSVSCESKGVQEVRRAYERSFKEKFTTMYLHDAFESMLVSRT